jgi:multidrug transporter EmrE-like cation transporter
MNFNNIHYIVWLVLSAVFFAIGEFLSKKFALSPKFPTIIYILLAYSAGVLAWLPAILQKNQLSVVGTLWAVLSLLTTILIGLIIFNEKLNLTGVIGIFFAFIAVILLSRS